MHRRRSFRVPIRRSHACGLIAVAALAATAAADTLYHKDGRVLRGRVEANGEKFYKLKLEHGSVTIKRSDVLKLKGGPGSRAAYDQRMAGATPENCAAWIQLGVWCESQGLDGRAWKAYRKAVAADPASLEPLRRLSALTVDDLVYRYAQAAEDDRGPILEQLRPHGDRGIDGCGGAGVRTTRSARST